EVAAQPGLDPPFPGRQKPLGNIGVIVRELLPRVSIRKGSLDRLQGDITAPGLVQDSGGLATMRGLHNKFDKRIMPGSVILTAWMVEHDRQKRTVIPRICRYGQAHDRGQFFTRHQNAWKRSIKLQAARTLSR